MLEKQALAIMFSDQELGVAGQGSVEIRWRRERYVGQREVSNIHR